MKNDFIPFCASFAKVYKILLEGSSLSSKGFEYTIEKTCFETGNGFYDNNVPVRVDMKTGKVQINCGLDKYSESAITFLLVWCFLRHIHQTEDSIPISNIEIDNKTIEALKDVPGFSVKEAITSLLNFTLKDTSSPDYFIRMEKLLTVKT